jgi:hypothetical protein
MNPPALLMHRAMVHPAQGDEVAQVRGTSLRAVHPVMPSIHKCRSIETFLIQSMNPDRD